MWEIKNSSEMKSAPMKIIFGPKLATFLVKATMASSGDTVDCRLK